MSTGHIIAEKTIESIHVYGSPRSYGYDIHLDKGLLSEPTRRIADRCVFYGRDQHPPTSRRGGSRYATERQVIGFSSSSSENHMPRSPTDQTRVLNPGNINRRGLLAAKPMHRRSVTPPCQPKPGASQQARENQAARTRCNRDKQQSASPPEAASRFAITPA